MNEWILFKRFTNLEFNRWLFNTLLIFIIYVIAGDVINQTISYNEFVLNCTLNPLSYTNCPTNSFLNLSYVGNNTYKLNVPVKSYFILEVLQIVLILFFIINTLYYFIKFMYVKFVRKSI